MMKNSLKHIIVKSSMLSRKYQTICETKINDILRNIFKKIYDKSGGKILFLKFQLKE